MGFLEAKALTNALGTGGPKRLGRTAAGAIPAGRKGEMLEAYDAGSISYGTTPEVILTLELTPGVWMLVCQCTIGSSSLYARVELRKDGQTIRGTGASSNVAGEYFRYCKSVIVNTAKVSRVEMFCETNSGSGFCVSETNTGALGTPQGGTHLQAIRIA